MLLPAPVWTLGQGWMEWNLSLPKIIDWSEVEIGEATLLQLNRFCNIKILSESKKKKVGYAGALPSNPVSEGNGAGVI